MGLSEQNRERHAAVTGQAAVDEMDARLVQAGLPLTCRARDQDVVAFER